MRNKIANNFIKQCLTSTGADLSAYEDEEFCTKVQLAALDDIIFILLTIKKQSRNKKSTQGFSLNKGLNTAHPQTNLSLLDYCLVAGLDQLALQAAFSGAKSERLIFFKRRLALLFDPKIDCPSIVLNILELINQLELKDAQSPSSRSLLAAPQQTNWQQLKTFCSDHKYPTILFTTGILGISGSIIVYPFLHGVASALLLSVGVPSILSSVNSLQSSNGGRDRINQSEMRDRINSETNELNELIKLAFNVKKDLQMHLIKSGILANGLAKNHCSLMPTASKDILYDFQRTSEPKEAERPSFVKEGFGI